MRQVFSWLKFFYKFKLVYPVRVFLLHIPNTETCKNDWEKRMLIVHVQAIGDEVIFTSVLKHYKKAFPSKKIYMLARAGLGLETIVGPYVDEVIFVDSRKFSTNPFYGVACIRKLRKIGFQKVLYHDFFLGEVMGKIISTSLSADVVVGYEGSREQYLTSFDVQQKRILSMVRKNLMPKFTQIIPAIDKNGATKEHGLSHSIMHHIAIFEHISGIKKKSYETSIILTEEERLVGQKLLESTGLVEGKFAVLNINASVSYKRWPLDRYTRVAELLHGRDIAVVLVGTAKEKALTQEFSQALSFQPLDLAGNTSMAQLIFLISRSLVVISNDTAALHIAVAMRAPLIGIVGGGQFGGYSLYGYPDINKWVYKKTDCFYDNWRCATRVAAGDPSPCIEAINAEMVVSSLEELLYYIKNTDHYPQTKFQSEFKKY